MKKLFVPAMIALMLLLAACGGGTPALYAVFQPRSGAYEQLRIDVGSRSAGGEVGETLSFTARGGEVFAFSVTVDGEEVVLAQDLPEIGLGRGESLGAEGLRSIVVGSGSASAGQFKLQEAEAVLDLIVQLGDPEVVEIAVPAAYSLLETSLGKPE